MTAPRTDFPPLWHGRRRRQLLGLVATGVGQAVCAVATALALSALLAAGSRDGQVASTVVLGAAAVGVGVLRAQERVRAERVSQDYVRQLRRGLLGTALTTEQGPGLGITVARTTNDLSAVRNWVALGITPLVVGVPTIVAATVALAVLDPLLAAAVAGPMLLLAGVLTALARPAFRRSRELRRRRGRLATAVSETVTAARTVRAGGGERRELRNLDRLSGVVAEAAVHRSRVAGALRGASALASALALAAVAVVGAWFEVSAPAVAGALTIVGLVAGPVTDLGRVVEYRQAFLAARRILAPVLAAGAAHRAEERRRRQRHGRAHQVTARTRSQEGVVHAGDLAVRSMPVRELVAVPGARVLARSADPARESETLAVLAGVTRVPGAWVRVSGHPLEDLPGARRRLLVGAATSTDVLERGTLARAVRYRDPESTLAIAEVLERVGLSDRVAELTDGERTRLRRGGEPLTAAERTRLLLARATFGDPPLVVLDRVDTRLGPGGHELIERLWRTYPGVIVVASDDPDGLPSPLTEWDLDDAAPTGGRAVMARPPRVVRETAGASAS
ncbi:ABC transporter ATP-binding protein/permease [Georgenia subflava]|uniref:ABC transporter ATP-binding protein n=1 Tax=Georgenia subflava TaxID=1622177 RepID=A0A6N7EH49_9MICO|nr:ABC transporter ATP-binding protein/permease [Georgenia subflava]MPV36483.1 ABC transporter ATP-binding protein [Georgenia subflava]